MPGKRGSGERSHPWPGLASWVCLVAVAVFVGRSRDLPCARGALGATDQVCVAAPSHEALGRGGEQE